MAAAGAGPAPAVTDSDARVAAICVLSRGESPDVHLDTLSGSAALVALLNHARVLDPADEPRKELMLTHYLEVAASVPVLALTIPSGLHRLTPALLDLGAQLSWWETPAEHPCLA
jgi:hypothetical protein